MFKAVLSVCALALMIQSIAGACIGTALAGPYDAFGAYGAFGAYDGLYDGFGAYGLYDGFGPYRAFDGFGAYGAFDRFGPYDGFGPYGAYGCGTFGYGIGPYAGPFRGALL